MTEHLSSSKQYSSSVELSQLTLSSEHCKHSSGSVYDMHSQFFTAGCNKYFFCANLSGPLSTHFTPFLYSLFSISIAAGCSFSPSCELPQLASIKVPVDLKNYIMHIRMAVAYKLMSTHNCRSYSDLVETCH